MVVYFWYIIQVLVGYHLVFPLVLYVLFRLTPKPKFTRGRGTENDYAIIVTAYQQTTLLPAVVDSILKLNYSNYLIYVVADNCDITTLMFLDPKVILLRPPEVLANNVKSHFYAINHFKRTHDLLTIIDSDNLVEPDYLEKLNYHFDKGFKAVQGVRKAKKITTTLAALDAARDLYYHFYDGEVLFSLGSSATLAGSGMAFNVDLYKNCLSKTNLQGAGFDKVLQAEILMRGERIAFAKQAVVYDEKTANSDQLVNQRARWINTWFKYFGFGFKILGRGIINLNLNQFIFGFVLLRPPLFMFLILSVGFLMVNIFLNPVLAICWLFALCLFIIGFYISLTHGNAEKKIYQSLVNIPKFIFLQLAALLHVRRANIKSVATTHETDVEE